MVSCWGWTGGSHFLGWLVTHSPVSGKTTPPTPDLMAQGWAAWGPAVGNVAVIRGRGLGEGNWARDRDEMLVGTPPTLRGNWAVLPELPG